MGPRWFPSWVWFYLWPLIMLTSRLYFLAVNLIFALYNYFQPRKWVPEPTDRLLLISATQAAKLISQKEITSRQLIDAYIRRIEQINPIINAMVVNFFDDARAEADEADRTIENLSGDEVKELFQKKPLLGVPFTVKDAFEIEDVVVTCGVYNMKDVKSKSTAESIIRMKNAGAVLLGITNVAEASMWFESNNTIYGRTVNPYDSRRIAGGSSGGEGALIGAAGSVVSWFYPSIVLILYRNAFRWDLDQVRIFSVLLFHQRLSGFEIATTSDIGGSIRIPSFVGGIFGMKPTPNMVPLDGHIPVKRDFQGEMLRIGPMCRYAEDLPLLLKILVGPNASKLNLDEPVVRKKLRLFYAEGLQDCPVTQSLSCEMRHALRKAVKLLEMKYDTNATRICLPTANYACEMFVLSMEDETQSDIREWIVNPYSGQGKVDCWKELPAFMMGKSKHTLPSILQGILATINPFTPGRHREVINMRDRLRNQLEQLLSDDGILLFPCWSVTAPFHNETVFEPFDLGYTALWNCLRLPAISCPVGLDAKGLPLGVQVGFINSNFL
ncbi:hypothetical protein WR25_02121 isoform B [Diploscapter pachys]|uniref:Amidase domain-containing protein n=1 Tax=Diploscapter pachys TaxID=2018661 RepID=A0A2A2LCS0_9BILA|nr:hypothetical protein WR25_02121 isoform B [Diploscapter pachys]